MLRTTIVPRMSETNAARHVDHTVVPVWFDSARRDLYRIFAPGLSVAAWPLAIANIHVDYLAEIFLDPEVEVRTWIERIGTKSFTVAEEVWQGGACCARGSVTFVHFDYATRESLPIPPETKARLERHLKQA